MAHSFDESGTEGSEWAGSVEANEGIDTEDDRPAWSFAADADGGDSARQRDHRCQHCGGHVTPRFERVMGDTDDVAHRCPRCDESTRLLNGSAAGQYPSRPDPFEGRTD